MVPDIAKFPPIKEDESEKLDPLEKQKINEQIEFKEKKMLRQ